jgi:hypothetical protein
METEETGMSWNKKIVSIDSEMEKIKEMLVKAKARYNCQVKELEVLKNKKWEI